MFYVGVAGPNAASAVTGALLAYVLPAASPGALSMIPDRLAGWWLASTVGTIAVLLLPTPAMADKVRAAATKLASALASGLEAALRGEQPDRSLAAVIETKHELLGSFGGTPQRPTGLAARDQALANAVEFLEWSSALIGDALREQPELRRARAPERDLLATSALVLRDSGALLSDSAARSPDLAALEERRRESLARVTAGWHEPPEPGEDPRVSFHADAISSAALAVGHDAVLAARPTRAERRAVARTWWLDSGEAEDDGRLAGIGRFSGLAIRHASLRSVWFVNSLRGSFALAVAVGVAGAASVQHGFWVVLGTLSVLRTNAAATGATALRALLGTAIGFVVGGALLVAIGASNAALWVALPVAVFVASYAPGAAPFAIGQAAFTVTVAVLFNLLVPVGWKVGEVRIEDVAIGCLVSVVVGALFWPRGVAPLVGNDLADGYRTGADYLSEAIAWVRDRRAEAPTSGRAALTAGIRLEEAVRGFLAEQGTKHLQREELWRLIGGTLRLRLTARSIAALPHASADADRGSWDAAEKRAGVLLQWYDQLALQLGRPEPEPSQLARPQLEARGQPSDGPESDVWGSRGAIWLQECVDLLAEHADDLTEPALHLAEVRRRPWWR